MRLPLEVTEAVAGVFGASRVGYKLSPYFAGYSMSDSNPLVTFTSIAAELGRLGLGYLHVTEPIAGPAKIDGAVRATPSIREAFDGTLIVNDGYDLATAEASIARGEADLVAFGKPFLANPDLPLRYRKNVPLNAPDPATFYAGEEKGYIDYPALSH
jgi:N-ethylmaleimide reductase